MSEIINYQLSKAAAIAIFEENAVFHSSGDAIDVHRVAELMGEAAIRFIDRTTKYNGFMEAGRDYNAAGASGSDPVLPYYFLSGWLKIVSDHNHRLQVIAHQNSDGGAIFDRVWAERCAAIDAADSEEERKRQERKAKRAAAKAAKEAAQA